MSKTNTDKNFLNFLKDVLLRYSIYFVILYLLYYNQLQIKTVFFNPYIQVLLFILIAYFIVKFIETKTKFYFVGYFIKNFLAIIIISFLFIYTDLYSIQDFFIKSFMLIVVMNFIGYLCLYYTDIAFQVSNNNKSFFETDEAIKKMDEEKLGRKEFIEKLKIIFEKKLEPKKGNVIGLFGKWGEGKSSIINLLEQTINKNIFKFIFINPWFNDTKEKMLNAVFGEINHFTKTNYPYKSLEAEFNDILKLSTIKIPKIPIEIDLNKFTVDKNIQNKIIEVGNILKKYSKRIIIVLDDLDRLSKDNILFILQIVQMFRENTNIVFILSCDDEKLKQILCEISEPCNQIKDDNKIIKTTLYYEDYINKIITIPIKLLKIGYFFITGELIRRLDIILQKQILINDSDLLYISTEIFKTTRDIKRFYNYFIIAYELVDKRVDIYNFINISILCAFYPELYDDAYQNHRQWFDDEYWKDITVVSFDKNNNLMEEKERKRNDNINSFFESIINKYNKEERQKLKELLFLISKPYNIANKKMIPSKDVHSGETSYFRDIRFLSSYFLQHNSFTIIIHNLELWYKEKNIEQRKKLIKDLIVYRIEAGQLENLFEYIINPLNYNKNYSEIYEEIYFVFAQNSLDIVDKKELKVLDYLSCLDFINTILINNKKYNLSLLIKETSSSVLSLISLHKFYGKLTNNFEEIFSNICSKIEKDIEIFLKSLYIQQNTMLFNICILAWLFGKQLFEVYKQKENALNINKLNEEEFKELKRKVHLLIPYFSKNIDWFKFFVLDSFLNFEFENNKIKNDNIKGAVVFPIQIWGLKNLNDGIEQIKDSNSITLFNNLIKDKSFIEELALERILKERKDFTEDFSGYNYFKDKSGFQENKIFEAKIIKYTEESTIELLRTEYIEDINKIVNRDFLPQQNYLSKILWQEKHENIENKKGIFIVHLICEEKDKQELEKNKNNLEDRLNSNKNIENKNFKFKIEIETRENLLSLYND